MQNMVITTNTEQQIRDLLRANSPQFLVQADDVAGCYIVSSFDEGAQVLPDGEAFIEALDDGGQTVAACLSYSQAKRVADTYGLSVGAYGPCFAQSSLVAARPVLVCYEVTADHTIIAFEGERRPLPGQRMLIKNASVKPCALSMAGVDRFTLGQYESRHFCWLPSGRGYWHWEG